MMIDKNQQAELPPLPEKIVLWDSDLDDNFEGYWEEDYNTLRSVAAQALRERDEQGDAADLLLERAKELEVALAAANRRAEEAEKNLEYVRSDSDKAYQELWKRAEGAETFGFNEGVEAAAVAQCSICRGMAGFMAVPVLRKEAYPWNSYWHPYDEEYGKGWTLCDSSKIRDLKRPTQPEQTR